MKNPNYTPVQTIACTPDGEVLYYTKAFHESRLKAGLYQMRHIKLDTGYVPAFKPIQVTNDEPLEIDTSISDILAEIDEFMSRRDVFKKFGFSHKRGYLLHGPPGCGKSSTLRLLEKRFFERFDGIVLLWDNGPGVREFINVIRAREDIRPILIVCEDIDAAIGDFEEAILELLDGHQGLDNVVLMATTNQLDRIPSRIKDRPSRIDRIVEIGLPQEKTRFNYLVQIGLAEQEAQELSSKTGGLSIAQLKEVVVATVCLRQPLAEVLKRLKVADMSPLDSSAPVDEDERNPRRW